MFGHQNSSDQAAHDASHADASADQMNGLAPETVAPTAATPSAPPVTTNDISDSDYLMTDLPAPTGVADTTDPSQQPISAGAPDPVQQPADDIVTSAPDVPDVDVPVISTAPVDPPAIAEPAYAAAATPTVIAAATPVAADSLLELKQSALHDLSPLLGQLEQSPEERFRTTMMMIQASDDQSLLQSAYDAARAISDEKVRAQALLDVVNEINYFTRQTDDNSAQPVIQ